MSSKMDFKNKIAYQIVTLFGLGRLPGGGTWASLFILFLVIIFEDSSTNALSGEIALYTYMMSFFSFGYLYEQSSPFFDSKDPKEFVFGLIMGQILGLGVAALAQMKMQQGQGNPTPQDQMKVRDMLYKLVPQIRERIFE